MFQPISFKVKEKVNSDLEESKVHGFVQEPEKQGKNIGFQELIVS